MVITGYKKGKLIVRLTFISSALLSVMNWETILHSFTNEPGFPTQS